MIGKRRADALAHLRQHRGRFLEHRLAGKAARFLRLDRVLQPVARKRRVGDDQAVEVVRQRFGGDVVHALLRQVRGDLQEDRHLPAGLRRLVVAGRKHGQEQRRQAFARLQVAQTGRVRRGDIGGEIASDRVEAADARHIVADTVLAILVGADIDADDALPTDGGQPPVGRLMAFIVEAKAIDDAFILDEAEDARSRIARLRLRRDRADFGKSEAEFQERFRHLGVLVETRRHAERIFKADAGHRLGETLVGAHSAGGNHAGFQRRDRKPVRRLGVEQEQAAAAERLEGVDHSPSSGKMWAPSAPIGSGFSHRTAETGSAA